MASSSAVGRSKSRRPVQAEAAGAGRFAPVARPRQRAMVGVDADRGAAQVQTKLEMRPMAGCPDFTPDAAGPGRPCRHESPLLFGPAPINHKLKACSHHVSSLLVLPGGRCANLPPPAGGAEEALSLVWRRPGRLHAMHLNLGPTMASRVPSSLDIRGKTVICRATADPSAVMLAEQTGGLGWRRVTTCHQRGTQ